MYVYSRGLNRLRWAGRLAGHVLVAVMPITAFGRALALCPRTHPANGHPGRAHHAKRAVGLTAPAADFVLLTVCGLTAGETQSLELTCAVEIPSCHDAIGRGLSHSALRAWSPSHQPCHSPLAGRSQLGESHLDGQLDWTRGCWVSCKQHTVTGLPVCTWVASSGMDMSMCLGVDMGGGMDSTAARSTCSRAQPSDPPR